VIGPDKLDMVGHYVWPVPGSSGQLGAKGGSNYN